MTIPDFTKASPRPWVYHNNDRGRDWIVDANGDTILTSLGHIDGPLICAAVNAVAGMPPAPLLWAVHVIGPDDRPDAIYCAKDYAAALMICAKIEALNVAHANRTHDDICPAPHLRPVPVIWTYGRDSHDHDLKRGDERFA